MEQVGLDLKSKHLVDDLSLGIIITRVLLVGLLLHGGLFPSVNHRHAPRASGDRLMATRVQCSLRPAMICFTVKASGRSRLALRHVWFAESPRKRDALLPCIFFHAQDLNPKVGFERRSRWTSIVGIDKSETELLNSFSRNTRYKINRAKKQKSDIQIDYLWPAQFQSQEDGGAASLSYQDNLVTSVVTLSGQYKIVHQYIIDHQLQRVHLYKSHSGYQAINEKDVKDSIARVNRWQHFSDMLYFRDKGFMAYDFGGFARAEAGTKLGHIDSLKQGFRGDLVEESMYIPWSIIGWNSIVHGRVTTV